VLAGGFVGYAMTFVFGTLLTANGSLRVLNRIALGGLLTNALLNVLLIPSYGPIGAAYATLFTQAATALLQMWVSKRFFKIPISFVAALQFGLAIILAVLAVRWSYQTLGFTLLGAGLSVIAICAATIITGFVNLKSLREVKA
jgi:O-antigen/teichoic acid export membrane protein